MEAVLEDGDIAIAEKVEETNGKIELGDKMRAMVAQRQLQIKSLQIEVELLLNGFMNGKGKEGNYRLNEDATALVEYGTD